MSMWKLQFLENIECIELVFVWQKFREHIDWYMSESHYTVWKNENFGLKSTL